VPFCRCCAYKTRRNARPARAGRQAIEVGAVVATEKMLKRDEKMLKQKGNRFCAVHLMSELGVLFFCLNLRCCLCPPDSVSRNGTKRKQPADGQRSSAVAKRREVKRSRTGRTQALNCEWRSLSAVFSRFWRNQRRSPVLKIAVWRRSCLAFARPYGEINALWVNNRRLTFQFKNS